MSTEKLNSFSAIFASLHVEEMPVGPDVICSCLYFANPIDRRACERVCFERLMEIGRFRSRIVKVNNEYQLVEMKKEEIDLKKMITEVVDVKTPADVNKFLSAKNKERMGVALPMWRAYILNSMADGRSCLILMIDHLLGDGVALVEILLSKLVDTNGTESKKPAQSGSSMNNKAGPSCFAGIRACLGACFNVSIGDQLPGDTRTRLKVKDHRQMKDTDKSLAQSPSVDVDRLKEVKNSIPGATINDVLMTVLTVCLRMYYQKYEPAVLEAGCCGPPKIRGNFPINLRGVDKKYKDAALADNAFSQGMVRFPIHLSDPMAMMRDIKTQIDVVKISPEPIMRDRVLAFLAAKVLPKNPEATGNLLLDAFGKVTAMLSNVQGPTSKVSLMGQPIDDMNFYVLVGIGLYFGLVTYNGRCSAGICIDGTSGESDANNLAELFPKAFERVYSAAKATMSE